MSIQSEILRINTEITVQEDLMNSIINALQGKSVSGGGSSVEMEEGIYTPTEDVRNPIINFNNNHSTPPSIIFVKTPIERGDTTSGLMQTYYYIDYIQSLGSPVRRSPSYEWYFYGKIHHGYMQTGGQYSDGDTGLTSTDKLLEYATENYFIASCPTVESVMYRTGYSYKWKAIWL